MNTADKHKESTTSVDNLNTTSRPITVERAYEERLEEIWPICTELARSMAYPSFFCTGDWLKVAAESVLVHEMLMVLVVKQGENVHAVLPLVKKRNSLGGRDLRFLGTDFYPDPVGLICAPSNRAVCAAALQKYLLSIAGWDRLILDWVLKDELKDWDLSGTQASLEFFKPLQQDFKALLDDLKKKNRRYLASKVKKIHEAGCELILSKEKTTQKEFLDALFSIHSKRSAERNIVSSINSQRVESFHYALIQGTEYARFYGLRLNQQVVAVFYGFVFGNSFFAYQIAHDPCYGDLGLGTAMLYFAIEDCCAEGLTEFNFLQGGESYKEIWSDESRMLYRAVINSGTFRSKLLNLLGQARTIAAGYVKRITRGV